MKIFFAGPESKCNWKILVEQGAKNILTSYYFYTKAYKKVPFKEFKASFGDGGLVFMDSGGFSARKNDIQISIKEYAEFLRVNSNDITIAANLDTNDFDETMANQAYLEDAVKGLGIDILPVYHLSEYFSADKRELLDDWVKKYNYIAIGGVAQVKVEKTKLAEFLNYIFARTQDKIKCHGFGITQMELVKKYPFYSVDSTTWLNGAIFGEVHRFEKDRIVKVMSLRVSANKKTPKMGDYRLLGHYNDRSAGNVRSILEFEKFVTKLWEGRGVKWN